ncbi:MAG: hypothetical protein ACLFR2_12605 [Candidatus Kapaibacterium sp.]
MQGLVMIIAALAVLLTSCEEPLGVEKNVDVTELEAPVLENQTDNVIMPLAIGNTWKYEKKYYGHDGNAVDSDEYTLSVVSDTLIAGKKWYKVVSNMGEVNYYHNRTNGLWEAFIPFWNDTVITYLKYSYPGKKKVEVILPGTFFKTRIAAFSESDSNKIITHYNNGELSTFNEALEQRNTVSVAAGSFDCYNYKQIVNSQYETIDNNLWSSPQINLFFAPELGPVKVEPAVLSNCIGYELKEYRLN